MIQDGSRKAVWSALHAVYLLGFVVFSVNIDLKFYGKVQEWQGYSVYSEPTITCTQDGRYWSCIVLIFFLLILTLVHCPALI